MSRQKEIAINSNGRPIRIHLDSGRTRPRVACLGPAGTYTEAARYEMLTSYLMDMDSEFLPDNPQVVRKVDSGEFDLGVVPIENAIGGDVADVLAALNHTKNLTILGERVVGIQHMLAGRADRGIINRIASHPQGLAQCGRFLREHYPKILTQVVDSTSAAAELASKDPSVLAIASRRAAQINELTILDEDIGDVKGNSTRFLLLGRGETDPTGDDLTSLLFVPKVNKPGILARCLTAISAYGIDLAKITSHPTGAMGQYAFWTVMQGHLRDNNVSAAIQDLRETYCSTMRIFGSYARSELPIGAREPGAINGFS